MNSKNSTPPESHRLKLKRSDEVPYECRGVRIFSAIVILTLNFNFKFFNI